MHIKKIFKYYLPSAIFFLSFVSFLGFYFFENHKVLLRYIFERATTDKTKIFSGQIDAVIKIDGIESENVRLFKENEKIYFVAPKIVGSGISVLVIDNARKDIFVPIRDCHEILYSKYLIQNECGSRGAYYSDEQKSLYDVKYSSDDSRINFQIPVEYIDGKVVKSEQIELTFVNKQ